MSGWLEHEQRRRQRQNGSIMELRPCIDIHNGKVKQLVGGSIQDQGDSAQENYISSQDAAWYARLFQEKGLKNGHVILLNSKDSAYYEQTRQQALSALQAYPGGLQVGGGITAENAREYLDAGASHVIVTSYVFRNGDISFENLNRMMDAVGKKRLVLDLSCRKKDGQYYIVTDRWQKFTQVPVSEQTIEEFSSHCDEFLVHAVDVEGKASGIEVELVKLLAKNHQLPVTYAGGVGSFQDLETLRMAGENRVDVTVGSALDLFGGSMKWEDVLDICQKSENYFEK